MDEIDMQKIAARYPSDSRYLPAVLQDIQAALGVISNASIALLAIHFNLKDSDIIEWLEYPDGFIYDKMIGVNNNQVCIGAFCREKNKSLLHNNNIGYAHCLSACHKAPAAMVYGVLHAPCVTNDILSYSSCISINTET
ncbi:MAG: hypothetical protein R8L53_09370 [Mariprofundales bacterium]